MPVLILLSLDNTNCAVMAESWSQADSERPLRESRPPLRLSIKSRYVDAFITTAPGKGGVEA